MKSMFHPKNNNVVFIGTTITALKLYENVKMKGQVSRKNCAPQKEWLTLGTSASLSIYGCYTTT